MTATPPEPLFNPDPDPDAPSLAGRYQLVRVVGSGGMGVVWEAVNTGTGRRVAVKLMHPPTVAAGRATLPADTIGRFLREARATARVRHPNVVEVLDAGRGAERAALFIVYELLEGETLRALLERRGRLAPDEAARILVPVMEGLAAAHRASVLHRDLKPENVMLAREPDGRVVPRLIDFGVARFDDLDLAGLTRTGAALGTAHYMSPEQARGARDLDARSDVWAAGVMWFEALAGALPYEGSGYNEVLAKILTSAPPRLVEVLPDAPRPLADAIDRALAHDRANRYATVDDFLAALRVALCPSTAAPPRRSPRSSVASRRHAVIAACAAVLALGAAFVGGFTRDRRASPAVVSERPRASARLDATPIASPVITVALVAPDASPGVSVGAPTPRVEAPVRRPEIARRAPVARRSEVVSATRALPRTRAPLVNNALVLDP